MKFLTLTRITAVAMSLAAGGCMAADPSLESDDEQSDLAELDDVSEGEEKSTGQGLVVTNGLKTNNGLMYTNGLRAFNGLSLYNGLTVINGVTAVNGLIAPNGSPRLDGILSNTKGLMKSAARVKIARYMAKCALSKGQSVTVPNWKSEQVKLTGQIGLAPEWLNKPCKTQCQEKVSACLLALTNGFGNHVQVMLTAEAESIGMGHSSSFPYQEAAYYGNLFLESPKAYLAAGKDFLRVRDWAAAGRFCYGTLSAVADPNVVWFCPIKVAHMVKGTLSEGRQMSGRCTQTDRDASGDGTATKCTDGDGVVWTHPITVWRSTDYNEIPGGQAYNFTYGLDP